MTPLTTPLTPLTMEEGLPLRHPGQSTLPQKESPLSQNTYDKTACAFSKHVSLYKNTDSRLVAGAHAETLDSDKKCISDHFSVKASNTLSHPLESSINELKEETICHNTASVLRKNFTKNCSEPSVFSIDDQHKYKAFINSDPKQDYLFIHRLKVSVYGTKGNKHDFVILRKDEHFHILQSMVKAFTLEEWILGDAARIERKQITFKERMNYFLLHDKTKSGTTLSKKDREALINKAKRHYKEFTKSKHSFNKIVKTKINQPCSKTVFNQKILPTLFAALKNSDDRPYLKIFSASRRYLTIKPEYKVFFEVYKARI